MYVNFFYHENDFHTCELLKGSIIEIETSLEGIININEHDYSDDNDDDDGFESNKRERK